jgi:dienelactone hydrolase
MIQPPRFYHTAWIPFAAGLLWLWCAASFSVVGFLVSLLPGCLLLASGASTLLYPGDIRIPQFIALGGLLGAILAIPGIFTVGLFTGLVLIAVSVVSFVVAGDIAIQQEPHTEDVPTPERSLRAAAQVGFDEAILATLAIRTRNAIAPESERIRAEVHEARQLFGQRGWLANPDKFHESPPPASDPTLAPARLRNLAYERMSFDSGYEPRPEEPGRERWLQYANNRRARAWIVRHSGEPRPWLVCIHGYEMGLPGIDLMAFQAARLHHKYGLNLALPVLPLHGPRRIAKRSGEGFLTGNFLDTIHAEAQAMWDMRRLIAWIRAQGAPAVGVYGLSLGGYNAALLAALDGDLACAVAGIPATDFSRLTWRHGAPLEVSYAERRGVVHDEVRELLQVVSPLTLTPQVPKERRYIFAGVSDRLVPPDQPRDLWLHWDRPRIVWYQGAHVTFNRHPAVDDLLMTALHDSNLVETLGEPSTAQPTPKPLSA